LTLKVKKAILVLTNRTVGKERKANNMAEIIYYKKDRIGYVAINRPEKLNSLSTNALKELNAVFEIIDADDEIKVVVLRGEGGRSFIAGADLNELEKLDSIQYRAYGMLFVKLANKIINLSKPVIAAVQGFAYGGGCYIALACDMVIATENSKFGQQEINLGFMGSTGLLPKLVGKHKAAEITMTGDVFDAYEAHRMGLVNKVVTEEDFDEEVTNMCSKLIGKSSYALQLIKTSIRIALETGYSVSSLYENEVASLCRGTSEGKEALINFLSKSFS
jgi:enoyl-CoA hydratase